jgi:hypothetical protein
MVRILCTLFGKQLHNVSVSAHVPVRSAIPLCAQRMPAAYGWSLAGTLTVSVSFILNLVYER